MADTTHPHPARRLLPGWRGIAADWTMLNATVAHGFTHFELELALAVARVEAQAAPADALWWPIAELDSAGLPTVFAKAAEMIRRIA